MLEGIRVHLQINGSHLLTHTMLPLVLISSIKSTKLDVNVGNYHITLIVRSLEQHLLTSGWRLLQGRPCILHCLFTYLWRPWLSSGAELVWWSRTAEQLHLSSPETGLLSSPSHVDFRRERSTGRHRPVPFLSSTVFKIRIDEDLQVPVVSFHLHFAQRSNFFLELKSLEVLIFFPLHI